MHAFLPSYRFSFCFCTQGDLRVNTADPPPLAPRRSEASHASGSSPTDGQLPGSPIASARGGSRSSRSSRASSRSSSHAGRRSVSPLAADAAARQSVGEGHGGGDLFPTEWFRASDDEDEGKREEGRRGDRRGLRQIGSMPVMVANTAGTGRRTGGLLSGLSTSSPDGARMPVQSVPTRRWEIAGSPVGHSPQQRPVQVQGSGTSVVALGQVRDSGVRSSSHGLEPRRGRPQHREAHPSPSSPTGSVSPAGSRRGVDEGVIREAYMNASVRGVVLRGGVSQQHI